MFCAVIKMLVVLLAFVLDEVSELLESIELNMGEHM